MTDTSPGDELLARAVGLLSELGDVGDVDADSAVVQIGTTRASVRVVPLGPGLDVLSVTQLVALNLPNTDDLRRDVETADAALSFGALRRSDPTGVTTDVLQYYTFPAGALDDVPLLTVLHIVLTAGAEIARSLTGA